jgi:hypothetical protein
MPLGNETTEEIRGDPDLDGLLPVMRPYCRVAMAIAAARALLSMAPHETLRIWLAVSQVNAPRIDWSGEEAGEAGRLGR